MQVGFLSPEQIAASAESMGLDTQLIEDATYFAIEERGELVGFGGWSRWATLYGGNHATDLRVLALCEDAARAEGFQTLELMATAAGEPLYIACGFRVIERVERLSAQGVAVPGAVMGKPLV